MTLRAGSRVALTMRGRWLWCSCRPACMWGSIAPESQTGRADGAGLRRVTDRAQWPVRRSAGRGVRGGFAQSRPMQCADHADARQHQHVQCQIKENTRFSWYDLSSLFKQAARSRLSGVRSRESSRRVRFKVEFLSRVLLHATHRILVFSVRAPVARCAVAARLRSSLDARPGPVRSRLGTRVCRRSCRRVVCRRVRSPRLARTRRPGAGPRPAERERLGSRRPALSGCSESDGTQRWRTNITHISGECRLSVLGIALCEQLSDDRVESGVLRACTSTWPQVLRFAGVSCKDALNHHIVLARAY